jgi:hypothetical protein
MAELIVYLSDNPDIGVARREVAHVKVPADGRPGSLTSTEFATFYGKFEHGTLNFNAGTYIELELKRLGGSEAKKVEIDDFDPRVVCLSCSDLNGTASVDDGDFLLMLAEYGQSLETATPDRFCLDSKLSGDKYVDLTDLLGWDAFLNGFSLNACGTGFPGDAPLSPGSPPDLPAGASLILAGKPGTAGTQQDYLYSTDTSGACFGSAVRPPSMPASGGSYRSNGRLIRDGNGSLYQVHATQGLIRMDTAEVILPPVSFFNFDPGLGPNVDVYVGVNDVGGGEFVGRPLLDVAFDPANPNILYVVPVVCVPTDSSNPFKAAAKLLRNGASLSLQQIYGYNPAFDPTPVSITTDEYDDIVLEPDKQQLREVEVDSLGNLYVLNGQAYNRNDWLLLYQTAGGTSSEIAVNLSGTVRAPSNMLLSKVVSNRLYLASAYSDPGLSQTRLYRFSITRSGSVATNVALSSTVLIDNPTGVDQGYGFFGVVTGVTEHPTTGELYLTGFTAPRYGDDATFSGAETLFTLPTFRQVGTTEPGPLTASALTAAACNGLALPVSIAYWGGDCPGDATGDRHVENADLQALLDSWNRSVGHPQYNPAADFDASGTVENADLQILLDNWARVCP